MKTVQDIKVIKDHRRLKLLMTYFFHKDGNKIITEIKTGFHQSLKASLHLKFLKRINQISIKKDLNIYQIQ